MFELNDAISRWRRQMAAGGIKEPEVLDELESHLRDEVDAQVRAGLGEQLAFDAAVRRIGEGKTLKTEFRKAGQRRNKTETRLNMKKYRSEAVIACLWVCVGFALCYFSSISHATSKHTDGTSKHADGKAELKRLVQSVEAYDAAARARRTAACTVAP